MNLAIAIKEDLAKIADPAQESVYNRFFKTGKGQYGEGDVFLGIKNPLTRAVAKKYFKEISFKELEELLLSPIHEHRFVALVCLVEKYQRLAKTKADKKEIFDFYIKFSERANNWDLVDISCPKIVGSYLLEFPLERKILYQLVKSKNLWQQRIAIVSTYTLIKAGDLQDCLAISEILLAHHHDLIHKAVGWMLRELGKKDQALLENFLRDYYQEIPRTTLRYAIERFEEGKRKQFLLAKF